MDKRSVFALFDMELYPDILVCKLCFYEKGY